MTSLKCSVENCKRDFDTVCAHCRTDFCTKHYIEHAKLANDDLLSLIDRLNSIISSVQENNCLSHTFQQLEEWREKTHDYVEQIYHEKKQRLQDDFNEKLKQQMKKLQQLSQQMKDLLIEGDVSFKQVEKMKNDIDLCEQQCRELDRIDCIEMNWKFVEIDASLTTTNEWFSGGTLLSIEQQIKLNEFYGKWDQKWALIYKGTRDGFQGTDFHRCCDHQGPTMTIIQAINGYLFGGYTSVSWESNAGYSTDNNDPFLFTLTNPYKIPPTRYEIKLVEYSILNSTNSGPIFGGGDIFVRNNSQTSVANYCNFPHSYIDTTGHGSKTFTGSRNFTTTDIEVYRLA